MQTPDATQAHPRARAGRSRALPFLPPAALAVLLAALCLLFAQRCEKLGTVNDLWFGSDVWRHIEWAANPAERGRAAQHPGTFVLFKLHGALLRALDVAPERDRVLGYSLPVLVLASLATAAAATLLTRGERRRVEVLLILVAVGPLLVFGPMAESHVPGGAALLLQGVLVLSVLRGRDAGLSPQHLRWRMWTAVGLGALAVSATLPNLLPALVLLSAVWGVRRTLIGSLASVATLVAVALGLHLAGVRLWVSELALQVARDELAFLPPFHPLQLWWSVRGLLLHPFGMPLTMLTEWMHPVDGRLVTSLREREPTLLQLAACALWCTAIVLWARSPQRAPAERRFATTCALALAALIVFHSFVSSYEAYIFSAHAWPFVALPGVLAGLSGSPRQRRCIRLAVGLALLQTLLGILWLERLPGATGARWPPGGQEIGR